MSCPWWHVTVKFVDGAIEEYVGEGCTPTEAVSNVFENPYSQENVLRKAMDEHGDVEFVQVGQEMIDWETEYACGESQIVEVGREDLG